jgi:7-cyano-7-deazaguanine reductase
MPYDASANKLLKLGEDTAYSYQNPNIEILEKIANPHEDVNYLARFTCPEFTSLCPVTGQPDFAKIIIEYFPNKYLLESKSLKLYLVGYRNHGAFHEDCTIKIAKDFIKIIEPKWLKISGLWHPRGGIPIDVFYEYGKKPNS